jgi:hypothetical protein
MTKRRIAIFSGLSLLTLVIAFTVIYMRRNDALEITFAECERMGGVAWQVDLYHPEICSSCAEYRECETEYSDYSEVCPECYAACPECQDRFSLYESCPECYGPCQACQNEYLNEFENEEERYSLCPECEVCDSCREELNLKIFNCPPCISCNECKEENKRYTNIGDVCPQVFACAECMERTGTYPDTCPDGRKKIGEISDAATWFQCCK